MIEIGTLSSVACRSLMILTKNSFGGEIRTKPEKSTLNREGLRIRRSKFRNT